jgi:hypothetical protein
MTRAAKKPAERKACECADDPVSAGKYWTCCVCRNWNLQTRKACNNCHHERGGEPRALRWDPLPSAARFEPPKGGAKT